MQFVDPLERNFMRLSRPSPGIVIPPLIGLKGEQVFHPPGRRGLGIHGSSGRCGGHHRNHRKISQRNSNCPPMTLLEERKEDHRTAIVGRLARQLR
jgi:hypothetical protein